MWRRFMRVGLSCVAVLALAAFAGFVALDPYDTGRMGLVAKAGTTEKGNRIGHASRVHDERFDAAIVGNSHVLTLDPDRLSRDTGLRFVTLAVPGTGVAEQMVLLDAYLARHSRPKALVVGVDWVYCLDDPRVQPPTPFPDWLYTTDRWTYLGALFGTHTLEVTGRRLLFLLGLKASRSPNGNFDLFEGARHTPEQAAALIRSLPRLDFQAETTMPGFAMLAARLDRVPAEVPVLLLLPPVAALALPQPGSQAAAALDRCKRRAFDLASGRPNVRVVDWLVDRPETRDLGNFWDPTHFYDGLAQRVEADLAAALAAAAHASRALPSGATMP